MHRVQDHFQNPRKTQWFDAVLAPGIFVKTVTPLLSSLAEHEMKKLGSSHLDHSCDARGFHLAGMTWQRSLATLERWVRLNLPCNCHCRGLVFAES
jgi:hypothetical protein